MGSDVVNSSFVVTDRSEPSVALLALLVVGVLSFFWTRNGRAPSGVTSEATQRYCENDCHKKHTIMAKLNRTVKGDIRQRAKQSSKRRKLTKTRERHKGKTAVLLQTVQTESKLPLCESNLTTGDSVSTFSVNFTFNMLRCRTGSLFAVFAKDCFSMLVEGLPGLLCCRMCHPQPCLSGMGFSTPTT